MDYLIPDRIKKPSAPRPALPIPRLHHPAAHTGTDHLIPWPADLAIPPTNLAPNAEATT